MRAHLTRELKAAAAGSKSLSIAKPIGKIVRIRSITLGASVATNFVLVRASLIDAALTKTKMVGLDWFTNLNKVAGWRDLDVEWPENWKLYIDFLAQAACTIYYTVEYEIIKVDPRKKRWGE